jgi:archaellum component FlaC
MKKEAADYLLGYKNGLADAEEEIKDLENSVDELNKRIQILSNALLSDRSVALYRKGFKIGAGIEEVSDQDLELLLEKETA